MIFQITREPSFLNLNVLRKFIKTCHWRYLRKYDIWGHHDLGWGVAFLIDKNHGKKLIIKKDLTPIYNANWKILAKIKTKFMVIHARKAFPWKKNFNNIHPIDVNGEYILTHNGTIKNDSFPRLNDSRLERIKNSTDLDSRKYLCSILDKLNSGLNIKESLETIFSQISINIGANAFLFNTKECNIINYHNDTFMGRHHTLFIYKDNERIIGCTTPLSKGFLEIENKSLIKIDIESYRLEFNKLNF